MAFPASPANGQIYTSASNVRYSYKTSSTVWNKLSASSFVNTITGSGAPALTIGNVGDYYIDSASKLLYGPKTAVSWGTGVQFSSGFTTAAVFPASPQLGDEFWHTGLEILFKYVQDASSVYGWVDISSSGGGSGALPASATGILYNDGSGTMGWLPLSWTTASRPVSPAIGQTGFNSTLGIEEYWDGTTWLPTPVTISSV